MTVISFIQDKLAAYHAAEDHVATVAGDLRMIISEFAHLGIRANYDPVAAAENRVLLHATRVNSRNCDIAPECNGIIIDYVTWRVVYRPTLLPNNNFSVKRVAENFARYRVYPLRDGTVIGLYYYHDEWRICTARGLDMARVAWCGVTYRDAVEAAMASSARPATSESKAREGLKWDDLDLDASYTVGFTHPGMHHTQETAFWLIRIAITETGGELCFENLDGIPAQLAVTTFATFQEVQAACQEDASSWGYILRSDSAEDSTILIESRRMMLVRTLVYDYSHQTEADLLGVSLSHYTFCCNLGDASQRENYTSVFPDRVGVQTNAMTSIRDLSARIVQAAADGTSSGLDDTAAWFYQHIAATGRLDRMTAQQVEDVILARKSVSVVARYLEPHV